MNQKKLKYFAAGSGLPEVKVILGGFVIRGFLGFRNLVVKTIGIVMAFTFGLCTLIIHIRSYRIPQG
jgi:chloride channel 3/4/5